MSRKCRENDTNFPIEYRYIPHYIRFIFAIYCPRDFNSLNMINIRQRWKKCFSFLCIWFLIIVKRFFFTKNIWSYSCAILANIFGIFLTVFQMVMHLDSSSHAKILDSFPLWYIYVVTVWFSREWTHTTTLRNLLYCWMDTAPRGCP